MRNILILSFLLFTLEHVYAQTDSLVLKNYEQKILDNYKLKNDLLIEKQNFANQSIVYKKDTLNLQKKIKELLNDITIQKQKLSDLNESKMKQDRDYLQNKVYVLQIKLDSLNVFITQQNQNILNKDKLIEIEKANAKALANIAKNDGKTEAFAVIINSYKNKSFNDLIKSSTKESVDHDSRIFNNDLEVNSILNDLEIYFNATDLLTEKCNIPQIKIMLTLLTKIKRTSKYLDLLKDNVEYYDDYNNALKETINKLIDADKHSSADGDSNIKELKLKEIRDVLKNYMYNFYDYSKYPYLFEVVREIIERKNLNVDTSIIDLLQKL